jgi:hypothetical protein
MSDLVTNTPGKIVGRGESKLSFGDRGSIPFHFDETIKYPSSNLNSSLIRLGSSLKLNADVSVMPNATDEMKLKIKASRMTNCPKGYEKKKHGCVGKYIH